MWILGDSQRCSSRFHPHFTSSFPNYPKFQYWHWLFSPTRTPNSKGRLQTWIILPMHLFQRLQSVLFFLYHKFNYRFHPLSLGEVSIQCFLGWGWCIPLPLPARTRRPSLREIVDLGMTWSWLEHRRRGLMRVYVSRLFVHMVIYLILFVLTLPKEIQKEWLLRRLQVKNDNLTSSLFILVALSSERWLGSRRYQRTLTIWWNEPGLWLVFIRGLFDIREAIEYKYIIIFRGEA